MTIPRFRALVLAHAKREGRDHLPWRRNPTPYRVLVSEIMLQQTQVDRVIPYYRAFLKRFSNVAALASAPLRDVLGAWQGLGYNRRGTLLHEAAKIIVTEHNGKVPRTAEELERLPGIGPYTAQAVLAFAHNEDTVFIETNLRTAVMHHFFPKREKVMDAEILSILEKALPKGNARMWYAALMDYGAFLKRTGTRINARSATYTKQKPFKGSVREVRGMALRALLEGSATKPQLLKLVGKEREAQLDTALATLVRDGMCRRGGTRYSLPHAGRVSGVRSRAPKEGSKGR